MHASSLNNSPQSYYTGVVERLRDGGIFGSAPWYEIEGLCKEAAAIISELQAGMCEGCGSTRTDEQCRREQKSCCPDRKMLDIAAWRTRAITAESSLVELQSDRDALKHDIERHLGIIAELEREVERRDFVQLMTGPTAQDKADIWRRKAEELATKLDAAESSLSRTQAALLFWMPGVDSRLGEVTRERAAQDATLLAGYTGPVDGPCWGNETLDSLSRIKSETVEACAKVAENYRPFGKMQHHGTRRGIASAIRSLSTDDSEKTAESKHSPSTQNTRTE